MQARWLTLGLLVVLGLGCNSNEVLEACDAGDCAADTGGADATGGKVDATGGKADGTGGKADGTGGKMDATGGKADATGGKMDASGGSSDADSGIDPMTDPATMDGGMEPVEQPDLILKTDGTELATCKTTLDCNKDLACVVLNAEGRGFCSPPCTADDECAASGDQSACSASAGACLQRCTGLDDDTCMHGMTCQLRSSFNGFACQYPPAPVVPVVPSAMWGLCRDFRTLCEDGLICAGGDFCSMECTLDADCAAPTSGSIMPSCQSEGGGQDVCVLDCSADDMGCPDGMVCQNGGTWPGGSKAARCVNVP